MGQYHYVCNLDKKEFLHPHVLGDGLKLMEFGSSGQGTMLGLAILLAASNGRGGGDFHVQNDPYGDGRDVGDMTGRDFDLVKAIVGRWAGDRIAIIGDYRETGDFPGFVVNSEDDPWADDEGLPCDWKNISSSVWRVINLDFYTRKSNEESNRTPWTAEVGDPYAILKEEVS